MIMQAIRTLLLDPSIGLASDRIYPQLLPQEADLPAITYSRDGAEHSRTFDGANCVVSTDVRVDVWAKRYAETQQIAQAVKHHFVKYSGVTDGLRIQQIAVDAEFDNYEATVFMHRASISFNVWNDEVIP